MRNRIAVAGGKGGKLLVFLTAATVVLGTQQAVLWGQESSRQGTAVVQVAQSPGKAAREAAEPAEAEAEPTLLKIPVVPDLPRVNLPAEPRAPSTGTADLSRCLEKLRTQRDALNQERDQAVHHVAVDSMLEGPNTLRLRVRVAELLSKLETRKGAKHVEQPGAADPGFAPLVADTKTAEPRRPSRTSPAIPPGDRKTEGPNPSAERTGESRSAASDAGKPIDAASLAHVLYRGGNYEQALKAYRMVNQSGMSAEERAPFRYLIAACLRRLGKEEEATALFREVANLRGDEQVAAAAQWQLSYLRWRGETEARLKELQARRQALEASP